MTPLVLGTTTAVAVLGAMAFLPTVIAVLIWRARSILPPNEPVKTSGRLRAALVGAGVALAAALLFSITDQTGITQAYSDSEWRSVLTFLPAVIAVAIDLYSARLEKKAEQDPDEQ